MQRTPHTPQGDGHQSKFNRYYPVIRELKERFAGLKNTSSVIIPENVQSSMSQLSFLAEPSAQSSVQTASYAEDSHEGYEPTSEDLESEFYLTDEQLPELEIVINFFKAIKKFKVAIHNSHNSEIVGYMLYSALSAEQLVEFTRSVLGLQIELSDIEEVIEEDSDQSSENELSDIEEDVQLSPICRKPAQDNNPYTGANHLTSSGPRGTSKKPHNTEENRGGHHDGNSDNTADQGHNHRELENEGHKSFALKVLGALTLSAILATVAFVAHKMFFGNDNVDHEESADLSSSNCNNQELVGIDEMANGGEQY